MKARYSKDDTAGFDSSDIERPSDDLRGIIGQLRELEDKVLDFAYKRERGLPYDRNERECVVNTLVRLYSHYQLADDTEEAQAMVHELELSAGEKARETSKRSPRHR